jgi:hypothetical protein
LYPSLTHENISYAKNISGERQKGSSKEKDVRMSNIIAAKGVTNNSSKQKIYYCLTFLPYLHTIICFKFEQLSRTLFVHPWVLEEWTK